MQRLYFIRHGQSQANVRAVLAGQTDVPLTNTGREQAKTAGQRMKGLGISHIVASPLSRTRDTAMLVANEISIPPEKIEFNELLLERSYGTASGLPYDTNIDAANFTDVEPLEALKARAKAAYEYLQSLPQDIVLIVSHGTFCNALYEVIYPDRQVAPEYEPKNAEVIQLV